MFAKNKLIAISFSIVMLCTGFVLGQNSSGGGSGSNSGGGGGGSNSGGGGSSSLRCWVSGATTEKFCRTWLTGKQIDLFDTDCDGCTPTIVGYTSVNPPFQGSPIYEMRCTEKTVVDIYDDKLDVALVKDFVSASVGFQFNSQYNLHACGKSFRCGGKCVTDNPNTPAICPKLELHEFGSFQPRLEGSCP